MNTADNLSVCPFGPEYQNYWDLLSPRERSMNFDEYGLFALTPRCFSEPILRRIKGDTIVDACCSVGGMSIALAETGKRVIAVELDTRRIKLARKNATLFEVSHRIEFVNEDVLRALPQLDFDTVFFDGQWSEEASTEALPFTLSHFSPDGTCFLQLCFELTDSVVVRTPVNFDFSELEQFNRPYDIEATEVDGTPVAYSIYFGH